ncbi:MULTISPECIES: LacI family DNA-binding transcriptional regulator [unclassified Luteococcus]|uniref:LacI family DNA-binding transcriptional regulator n=1 Tax=unclassified Luteococcus TaxID=2639923 RepID=UPI00313B7C6E
MSKVTIYDVAREAGVSASTVSRAFSRPGRVKNATAQHIREVAELLGYRAEPLVSTPALSRQRTRTIGVAVSDITNPFYFGIIRGAEKGAAALDHSVMLIDAQESEALERTLLDRTLPLIDALVMASSRLDDTRLRQLAKEVPVMMLNRVVQGLPSIIPDSARGMRRSVEHLTSLGHRHIWYAAGPEASWANGARYRAFREASHELVFTEHRIGPFPPTLAGGVRAADELVERQATAVVAFNDLMALGMMRRLRARGVRVPEDISVVGFDDSFGSDLVTPRLTTVAAPLVRLGELATTNVIAMVDGKQWRGTEPIVVPVALRERESTAPPRRA